jgi:hypothetical protein
MPLLAYTHSGDPLIAPLMTDHEWEHLRSARNRDAWMPHGKGRAVPKISRLGTRFFAHPPGHTPQGARETDVHLYLKAQCLVGARAAGWDALPEQFGTTPDGQDWRADVLCRRRESPGPSPLRPRFSSRAKKPTVSGRSVMKFQVVVPSGWSFMSDAHRKRPSTGRPLLSSLRGKN